MKNLEIIKEIIDQRNDVATIKIMKACYPEVIFNDKDDTWQAICKLLVKNAMYDLFVYNNFEQEESPDKEAMAKVIYEGANILYTPGDYDNEPEQCKQHCRYMAQIALEYVLPALREALYPVVQFRPREKGFRGWIKAFIKNIKDIFENAGG